jgi:hypothetical protein
MTHPNDMTTWAEIGCQRRHDVHDLLSVAVDLGRGHGYADCPEIPARFARRFEMLVFDWSRYAGPGPYCPANDAVSETIDTLDVWEPAETIAVLSACTAAAPGSLFVDFGSQVGWFTLLAASCGVDVIAYEADPANVEALRHSLALNGWTDRVGIVAGRVDADTAPLDPANVGHVALAKIDLEGAEPEAVRVLWPLIEQGRVDHLLVEVSPVFHGRYPSLCVDLVEAGYRMRLVPDKATPPPTMDDLPHDLGPDLGEDLPAMVAAVTGWHQKNVWFHRDGAPWA